MRRVASFFLQISLLAAFAYSSDKVPIPTENSLVQIAVITGPRGEGSSYGTGFFVRDDGIVATAAHVYLKALNSIIDSKTGVLVARRFVRSNSREPKWVASGLEFLKADYPHDLVLLKMSIDPLWKQFGGIQAVTLDPNGNTEDGDPVCMRGYFGSDRFPVYLRGIRSGVVEMGLANVQELLITLPVVPGHSGSPLISLDTGRVIGVINAIVPVGLPFNQQPSHSGLARATEVMHLKRLVDSLPK